ncbi:hypothetical protein OZX72_05720 [Bifidobacterium sp. ESL0769]|uniref:hypothetical protein n=1 Tax=Bifidobacterium sp. ESL0769 TaxID=2983229 RepID=UPI0023F9A00B|nr:hypothetical protein [Bifidobacterium sp. ESL0769]WEV66766.1 hypothetical protein OZX72_05720 [Bifidobacterium sp. ESL0769]
MTTATVSAKIDKQTEELADSYIRKAGLTADKLINQLWSSIASTGVVPKFGKVRDAHQHDNRRKAFEKAQNIVSTVPKGTKLASMSYDDIHKEPESRNV